MLIDDWSVTPDPDKVFAAVEPTAPRLILLFTSQGPEHPTSQFYRRSEKGQTGFHAFFIAADARPDRDAAWWRKAEREKAPVLLMREYPRSASKALEAGGAHMFDLTDLEERSQEGEDRIGPRRGGLYSIGADLGSKHDSTVFTVVERIDDPDRGVTYDVVEQVVIDGQDYAMQGAQLRELHARFNNARCAIEQQGPGQSFSDNLDIPEKYINRIQTTLASKPARLNRLALFFRTRRLVYDANAFPDLHRNLLGAVWDPKAHTPDRVMSLSFAIADAEEGRLEAARKPEKGHVRVLTVETQFGRELRAQRNRDIVREALRP